MLVSAWSRILPQVFTSFQALEYIAGRIRISPQRQYGGRTSRIDEAREALASLVLCHVPVVQYGFHLKAIYLAYIVRRLILVSKDPKLVSYDVCVLCAATVFITTIRLMIKIIMGTNV